MLSKAFKNGLGLALAMVVLAGCSSTDTATDSSAASGINGASGGSSVTTGSAQGSDLNASGDTAMQSDTVFYFEFDSAVIDSESRAALITHAEKIKASGAEVRLEGHADERGTREYNIALGERRANAVSDFLALQGVSRSQIEAISYGEEYPAMTGSSQASYAKNRRVELK